MYILQLHSLEVPEPYHSYSSSSSSSHASASISILRCCVRLLRHCSRGLLSNPANRSTVIFVAAVPSYVSFDDFLSFAQSHPGDFLDICFFRNDAIEDRYSVLITLSSRLAADGFYCSHNGKRFQPSEVCHDGTSVVCDTTKSSKSGEACHLYFVQSVKCFMNVEEANAVPPSFVELPNCPVCLERLDHDTGGILTAQCDHSFQCPCVLKWTYLSCQVCRLFQQQDEKPSCAVCGTSKNLWACLICGFVGCGRYEGKHAIRHWEDTQHCYSLELEKQQVWDYSNDSYVHRLHQSKVDGKSAMKKKSCMPHKDECGACECSDDSGIGGAMVDSKVEVIVDEYNHLLATQMETQRQHYESLLIDAKSRKDGVISKRVENALSVQIEELRSMLERCGNEKTAVANKNKELMLEQENLKKKVKEIEERELVSLNSKDKEIQDLQEQIRDMTVFIETQKKVSAVDDIKGGTVLPVVYNSAPAATSKKKTKSGRKRN